MTAISHIAFQHRCIQDLAWVIASPPLVSGVFKTTRWWDHAMCMQEFQDCLATLIALDKDPQPLRTHLNKLNSKRLGLYFESLVAFWLASVSPNFKLLAQNIQLHEIAGDTRSRTVGEVDFIIEEVCSQKVIHLEVAVKFYLGTAPFNDPYRWFGTNTRDQLGKKIGRLKQHQTQLLFHYPEQSPFVIDERHCLLKGRLFYPAHSSSLICAPQGVTANHLRGRYYFYGQSVPTKRFIMLEKQDWLAEYATHQITKERLQTGFDLRERAYCYAIVEQESSGEWHEVERVFCLPIAFVFPAVV